MERFAPTISAAFGRLLGTRPVSEFFGRRAELDWLTRLALDGSRGLARRAAVGGPPGSGKSELLRQFATRLAEHPSETVPLVIDLAETRAEAVRWRDVMAPLLRQILTLHECVDPNNLMWLDPEPARLAGLCHGAGLAPLAPLTAPGLPMTAETWRALLRATASAGLAGPVIVLLGAAAPGSPGAALRGMIAEACAAERGALVCEGDAGDPAMSPSFEPLELGPLSPAEALGLARTLGHQHGWRLPETLLAELVQRLGPWPGWLRDWAGRPDLNAEKLPPRRALEQSYIEWLADSAWSRMLGARLERELGWEYHEHALQLVEVASGRQQPLALAEAAALLGVTPGQAGPLLGALAALGLLARRGGRWGGAPAQAVADWAGLRLAEAREGGGGEAARLALLTRLLTEPASFAEAQHGTAEAAARDIDEVADEAAGGGWTTARATGAAPVRAALERFRGQPLPRVLFQFGNYYEAVGRMNRERRREAALNASAVDPVPEVIGVVPWFPEPRPEAFRARGEAAPPAPPPMWYARAYREGRYQRSHEEVWIACDWSSVRALTTPEVEQALGWMQQLERRLGPGRYVRWIILGQTASPEALELIARERLLVSSLEQLELMIEALAPPPPRQPHPERPGTAHSKGDGATDEPAPPRRPVIEVAMAAPPRAETSNLSLPARADSELVAALLAEKLALGAGFGPAAAGQIKTAVLEGVINAIEHSPNPEKLVEISFNLDADSLVITIENEGRGFDPLAVPTPTPQAKLAASRKRGWGIMLMRRFMDEVGYEPCRRGTRLRLVKRRPAIAQAATPTTQALRG